MGKLAYFRIQLQNQSGVFRPGDVIFGSAMLKVNERFKINQIRVTCIGDIQVHWTESHGGGKSSHIVSYKGQEELFSYQIILKSKVEKEDLFLEKGQHALPFQISLPPNLPTSVESQFGRIRYAILGVIDIPWFFNKHCHQVLTIKSNLDLREIPALREPRSATDSMIVCCWCCKSGPIAVTFSLRKGGYIPGERAIFDVQIVNSSSRQLKHPIVSLCQQIILNATQKTKKVTREIASITLPNGVESNSTEDFNEIEIVIPPVSASTLSTSRVLQVAYFLDLFINPSGPAKSMRLKIPIVIGTSEFDSVPNKKEPVIRPEATRKVDKVVLDVPRVDERNVPNKKINSSFNYPLFKDFSLKD